MFIYQIGDWRNALVGSSVTDASVSLNRSARVTTSVLSNASGVYPHADPFRPALTAGEYTLKGTLVSGHNAAETVDQQYSYLASMIGRPYMPIIALAPSRELRADHNDFPTNCNKDLPKDRWLLTYGVITSVDREHVSGADETPTIEAMDVSVSITAGPYWEPLDYIRWKWWTHGRLAAPYSGVVSVMPPVANAHPSRLDINDVLNPPNIDSGFSQVLFDAAVYGESPFIDPANWIRAYARSADTFFEQHLATLPSEDPADAIAVLLGGVNEHVVSPDQSLWSAQPRSLYYFSNFAMTGAYIAITVETRAPNGIYTSTSSVSVDDIDAILVALSLDPVKPTDRMLVGGFGTSGGYFLRDNGSGVWEPINFFIPWRYNGLYPGETFPGYNKVKIQGPDTVQFSYAHIYRTL